MSINWRGLRGLAVQDLAEIGEIGGAGVRDGEVEQARSRADGHLVIHFARGLGAIVAGEQHVELAISRRRGLRAGTA